MIWFDYSESDYFDQDKTKDDKYYILLAYFNQLCQRIFSSKSIQAFSENQSYPTQLTSVVYR